jgi:hypothetical protein
MLSHESLSQSVSQKFSIFFLLSLHFLLCEIAKSYSTVIMDGTFNFTLSRVS